MMKEKIFKDNCNVCFLPFFKLHEEALWNTVASLPGGTAC